MVVERVLETHQTCEGYTSSTETLQSDTVALFIPSLPTSWQGHFGGEQFDAKVFLW